MKEHIILATRMAAVFGRIGEYDKDKEEWKAYVERLQHFFAANKIEEKQRLSVFLSTIGASTYQILRGLVAPRKAGELELDVLLEALEGYFSPKPSQTMQRFKFHSRNRLPGESINAYVATLRRLSEHCEFGTFWDEMLRDRLVCGIEDPSIQKRLLAERKLDFQKALDIALAMESANRDLKNIGNDVKNVQLPTSSSVHKLSSRDKPKQRRSSSTFNCYRCNSKDHAAKDCSYKQHVCHFCKKKGHLKKACNKLRSRGNIKSLEEQPPLETAQEHDEYSLFALSGDKSSSITVNLTIEGSILPMEVDTGSSRTIISKSTFCKYLTGKQLTPTNARLKTYSGQEVKVCGELMVNAAYGGQQATLPLLVVEGDGQSLLGRDWLHCLKLDWHQIFSIHHNNCMEEVLSHHKEVFGTELGTLKGYEVKIQLEDNAQPKFCRARPVPLALKPLVEKELDNLVHQGVLQPVEFSDWAAPIVPVLKSDKSSIRICGDFRLTVNKFAKVDRYPLPRVDELLSALAGGKLFTKLDLTQAYQQISLDEESRKLVVINTHKGLFQFNRMPFGISSAPGAFQRVMESLLQGIPHVAVFLDDILITGTTNDEHLASLREVLSRMEKAGLRLKETKCKFFQEEIEYLGFNIDAEGIHPTSSKLEAITSAPAPENVSELKSYLGLLSYYSKFLPNLCQEVAPLYRLLRKSTPWKWSQVEQSAFSKSKDLLSSGSVLVHYDVNKEIFLACDASQYGLGVVLSHKMQDGSERPVAFASRTLSKAERNYSQVEKEGLACIFGVKKFHSFLFGRKFTIITDHKPLLTLFSEVRPVPTQCSARIQRWSLTLSAYDYEICYRSSKAHSNADALSRLPLPVASGEVNTPLPAETVLLMEHFESSPVTAKHIERETSRDPVLWRVLEFVRSGWPDSCPEDRLKPYWTKRWELSVQNNCLLWGNRVVIPRKWKESVLTLLHESHPGIVRMKATARMFLWYPGLDHDIEATVKSCEKCQLHGNVPPPAPLQPWIWPSQPWSRLHIDYAGPYLGHHYLVVIDAHSKWIEAYPMSSVTSTSTIEKLRILFAQFGLPNIIVSDNGANFTSAEFQAFCHNNGIKHVTSAPFHPSSNGLAERAVQTVKRGLAKMSQGSITDRLSRFLFRYRNTPLQLVGSSPAELLLGRRVRSLLDQLKPNSLSQVEEKQFQATQKRGKGSTRSNFQVGDSVYVRNYSRTHGNYKWVPAVVETITGPVSLTVRVDGSEIIWRRHLDQVKARSNSGGSNCSTTSDYWHPSVDNSTIEKSGQSNQELPPKRISRPPDRLTYSKLGGGKM